MGYILYGNGPDSLSGKARARAIARQEKIAATYDKQSGRRSTVIAGWPSIDPPRVDAEPPDAGALRSVQSIRAAYFTLEDDGARCQTVKGQYASSRHTIAATDGHVALLDAAPDRDTLPESERPRITRICSLDWPERCMLDADVWRAYARVRTCRPRIKKAAEYVRWTIRHGGILLEADDRDGNTAAEFCPCGTSAADGEEATVALDDAYVWPMRGRPYLWRQGSPDGAVWFQSDAAELSVVVMPVRPR